jgi:hypothetical protein
MQFMCGISTVCLIKQKQPCDYESNEEITGITIMIL